MKKSIIVTIIIVVVIVVAVSLLVFIFKDNNQSSTTRVSNNSISGNKTSAERQPVEKIEVVHFHATRQCWSCITVGKYALKTIKEKFPKEYQNGTIIFKDVNVELPKNKDIVMKYQAWGSSLFVNAITNGKDNIEEDLTVWRLIYDESQFINYFENKLKKLLGK